jgi:hypothetical protein
VTARRQTLAALALFSALAVVMTWPQAARFATAAPQHHDIYFNMWRLEWFAHALSTSPRHLFDGNIFYPERRAMTMSDAMVVEGVAAAPMLWLGLPRVLVHNVLLLGAIALSGVGMFVLTRRLTSSATAAVAAGIIFAFAPYRFEHIMHMELQWAMWVPLTFWALDRTIQEGRLRDGLLTGLFAGLQVLSSIYYGLFLATVLAVGTPLLLLASRGAIRARVVRALAAGALVAAALASVYASPYSATQSRVGARRTDEVTRFSARPSSYLVATPDNYLYGRAFQARGRGERRLFPGLLAVLLALVGLLLRKPGPTAIVYLLLMTLAFEMSLGLSGYSFALLYDHVPVFSGLRAIARLGLFVLFFVAALAALGMAALESFLPRAGRIAAAIVIWSVLLLEYWVAPIHLTTYPNTAPPLYAWLATQPRGIVAEFPMPAESELPYAEPVYTYMSTFHWKPIVNGYSGYVPPSYLFLLGEASNFPDDRAIVRLQQEGVRYVIVHPAFYRQQDGERVVNETRARSELRELGRYHDGTSDAVVFQLR